ncbi:MAG: dihydroorotate dehydrogenase-like protein [Ignavibacteriales bacterium]|nr:dihydroorotate dehydrogenase-like protein [Ignavibacteriales bacterium]
MPNLGTKYMNLNLKNPIIVGSSGLTSSVEKVKAAEVAGAGAVVLKSLFEEVLANESEIESSIPYHPEALDYYQSQLEKEYGARDYIELIKKCKAEIRIPIIASINCQSAKWWANYTKQIESAGADAIELNVFTTANNTIVTSRDIEQLHLDILESVKNVVKIPVSLKIGIYFTSLPNFAVELDKQGLNGLVIFNRFTEPDIDINSVELKTSFVFSSSDEILRTLRWTALLKDKVEFDISATTGIQNSDDVIKMLLAGASTVQLVSILYREGVEKIKDILKGIEEWMTKHNFNSIDEFKGKLSFARTKTPEHYLRAQFIEKIKSV